VLQAEALAIIKLVSKKSCYHTGYAAGNCFQALKLEYQYAVIKDQLIDLSAYPNGA
jgi:hypothetical protein